VAATDCRQGQDRRSRHKAVRAQRDRGQLSQGHLLSPCQVHETPGQNRRASSNLISQAECRTWCRYVQDAVPKTWLSTQVYTPFDRATPLAKFFFFFLKLETASSARSVVKTSKQEMKKVDRCFKRCTAGRRPRYGDDSPLGLIVYIRSLVQGVFDPRRLPSEPFDGKYVSVAAAG
jgi:hypothetical protein